MSWAPLLGGLGAAFALLGCARSDADRAEADRRSSPPPARSASAAPLSQAPAPSAGLELLHLPESDELLPPPIAGGLLPRAPRLAGARCPPDMVDVQGAVCIDRFEVALIDAQSGLELSPFYHPTRAQTRSSYERYRGARARARAPSVPEPPEFQLTSEVLPRARAAQGVVPQGYLSADVAAAACNAAGKRLCTPAEWIVACRGQQNRKFPYGDGYADGACNVFREQHPAAFLHGDASREHLDPRLNLVSTANGPLLRRTGATVSCRSEWGSDAVFDMVGNLDEWVSDGSFAGGFYARATREGCDARITSHAAHYFDYSLGTRCCR